MGMALWLGGVGNRRGLISACSDKIEGRIGGAGGEEGDGIERSSAGSGRGEEEQRARERKKAVGVCGWKMTTGQN